MPQKKAASALQIASFPVLLLRKMRPDPGPTPGRPVAERRPCELRPPRADTHTRDLAYFTHATRVADEILHAHGYMRHHAALLQLLATEDDEIVHAVPAPPSMLAHAAAATVLAAVALPPVLADATAAALLALAAPPPVLADATAAAVLAPAALPPVLALLVYHVSPRSKPADGSKTNALCWLESSIKRGRRGDL